MILYARADNFYASCECLFRPDLSERPVVIAGEETGRVIAVNDRATAIGIQKGDRYADIAEKTNRHNAAVFNPNWELYADMAARLVAIYNRLCPDVEIHDTGACFLAYNDVKCPDFTGIAHHIRNTIVRETGISVSIGIAPTRTLAKIAGALARRTGGVFAYDQTVFAEELAHVPVTELWGPDWAARALSGRYSTGTALELMQYPDGIPERKRSEGAYTVAQELKGIPAQIIPEETRNSFSETVTFDDVPDSQERLDQALRLCTETAVKRLAARHEKFRFLSLYLVATQKNGDGPRYCNQLTASLPYPTAFLPEILKQARTLLGKLYRNGFSYYKLVIQFQKLEGEAAYSQGKVPTLSSQLGRFFRPTFYPSDRHPYYSRGEPKTTNDVGRITVDPARILTTTFIPFARAACHAALPDRKWNAISGGFRSPAYTTEFADLPSVR